ncbi:MAG: exonuclease SbcCD subunit D C-terminal domain-containing protein, partial [Actinomycetota bacterium]|nr:exonuclease SbcCD subunit D C-terminal domain-containing protein [Actinomycetota bacterium]
LQADRLASARWHVEVLRAAMSIISSAHSFEMPMIVLSHSFISGGITSDSERDVQVGGIPHAPISLFAGVSYLALGHLHRPQQIGASSGVLARYAGSPLAYSFSEEGQEKSVVLIDVASNGDCAVDLLQAPSPRPLTTIRGELASLLSEPRYQDVQEHWIRAVLTDSRRPESPMERIRQRFPHTLQLEFAPEGVNPGELQPAMSAAQQDPSLVVAQFIEYVTGTDATEHEMALIHEAVVRVRMGMVV